MKVDKSSFFNLGEKTFYNFYGQIYKFPSSVHIVFVNLNRKNLRNIYYQAFVLNN